MKKIIRIILLVLTITACGKVTQTPTITPEVEVTQTPIEFATATITPIPLSFVPNTYTDDDGKFSIQIPDTWTVIPEQMIGDRGSQTLLLSPGSSTEEIAAGGSRIVLVKYLWDPKNDLAAWVTQRKLAWEASGFIIKDESTRQLEDGRAVIDLYLQTPDKNEILISLTTIDDRYLEINAQGNKDLCREILGTLKSN
jgi:hypothetical protein